MLNAAFAILATSQSPVPLPQSEIGVIERKAYGVPLIKASSYVKAMQLAGQAQAEDRLWQMEMSRRSAQGQLAEVLGPDSIASDKQVLQRAYSDEEYATFFTYLPKPSQDAVKAYVAGVNDVIQRRTANNTLPPQYEQLGFSPRPWTVQDSCAIAVMMSRMFGTGGAGELRNFAVMQYLDLRPTLKDKKLDVMDDFLPLLVTDSPTTVARTDDPVSPRPTFSLPTRLDTKAHLESLPKVGLFELAGAISAASYQERNLLAKTLNVPYKTGSYAVVVAGRRSASGKPMLLSAPQMGHQNVNAIHEMTIDTPEVKVAGISVPGAPGTVIGMTPHMAWGLTSGVADVEDIFVSQLVDEDTYLHQNQPKKFEKLNFTLKVKGQPDQTVTQLRTVHGPVILNSKAGKAVFSQKSSHWNKEISSYFRFSELYTAKNPKEIDSFVNNIPLTFNLFFAFNSGEIGYRYLGLVPVRPKHTDPRLPLLDTPENQWQGYLSAREMPRVDNPASGLITNWNNKPVWWWPNFDTPVWTRLFRNTALNDSIPNGTLTPANLEKAAWTIARQDAANSNAFIPIFAKTLNNNFERASMPTTARLLANHDGWRTQGSISANLYRETIDQLRRTLFLPQFGNLTNEGLFTQAVQPSLILNALEGKTYINWLKGRTPDDVILEAYNNAVSALESRYGKDIANWGYRPGTIPWPGGTRAPYNTRGTFIQIIDLGTGNARSILNPGIAETGPNQANLAPLAAAWQYKPIVKWSEEETKLSTPN